MIYLGLKTSWERTFIQSSQMGFKRLLSQLIVWGVQTEGRFQEVVCLLMDNSVKGKMLAAMGSWTQQWILSTHVVQQQDPWAPWEEGPGVKFIPVRLNPVTSAKGSSNRMKVTILLFPAAMTGEWSHTVVSIMAQQSGVRERVSIQLTESVQWQGWALKSLW